MLTSIPEGVLSDLQLKKFIKTLSLDRGVFRGVYSRDRLPKRKKRSEFGILNLDSSRNKGTHWCAWRRIKNIIFYFDPWGIPPPIEFRHYANPIKVVFSTRTFQNYFCEHCGALCLIFILIDQVWRIHDYLFCQEKQAI